MAYKIEACDYQLSLPKVYDRQIGIFLGCEINFNSLKILFCHEELNLQTVYRYSLLHCWELQV